MITSMRGCVAHNDLWLWCISARSLSHDFAITLLNMDDLAVSTPQHVQFWMDSFLIWYKWSLAGEGVLIGQRLGSHGSFIFLRSGLVCVCVCGGGGGGGYRLRSERVCVSQKKSLYSCVTVKSTQFFLQSKCKDHRWLSNSFRGEFVFLMVGANNCRGGGGTHIQCTTLA